MKQSKVMARFGVIARFSEGDQVFKSADEFGQECARRRKIKNKSWVRIQSLINLILFALVMISILTAMAAISPAPPPPAKEFTHHRIMELEQIQKWILNELILREKENSLLRDKINALEIRIVKMGG